MLILQKTKITRLKGERLKELNSRIHYRDGNCCILCGKYVQDGEKFHHEKKNGIKNDVEQEGATLCYACHQQRHFGDNCNYIKERCRKYLEKLYPAYWSDNH